MIGQFNLMKVACLVLFLYMTTQISCPNGGLQEHGDKKITDPFVKVPYCELIQDPSAYNGKKVQIAATYRSGYEWSELYDSDCYDFERRTWVEFGDLNAESRMVLEDLRTQRSEGRTLSVTFAGIFESSTGNYGHQNGYKYLLKVTNVEQADILFEGSELPVDRHEELIR